VIVYLVRIGCLNLYKSFFSVQVLCEALVLGLSESPVAGSEVETVLSFI